MQVSILPQEIIIINQLNIPILFQYYIQLLLTMEISELLNIYSTDNFYIFMKCLFAALRKVLQFSQNKEKISYIDNIFFFPSEHSNQNNILFNCQIRSQRFSSNTCVQQNCFHVFYFLYSATIPEDFKKKIEEKYIPTQIEKTIFMLQYFFIPDGSVDFNEFSLIVRLKQDLERFEKYKLHLHGKMVTTEKKKNQNTKFSTEDIQSPNFFQHNFSKKPRKLLEEKRPEIKSSLCNCSIPSSMRAAHVCDKILTITQRNQMTLKLNEKHFQNIFLFASKQKVDFQTQQYQQWVLYRKQQDQKTLQAQDMFLQQCFSEQQIQMTKKKTNKRYNEKLFKKNKAFDSRYKANTRFEDDSIRIVREGRWYTNNTWNVYIPEKFERMPFEDLIFNERYGNFWKNFKENKTTEINQTIMKIQELYSPVRFNCTQFNYQPSSVHWKHFQSSYEGINGIFSEKMFAAMDFKSPTNEVILVLSWIVDLLLYKPQRRFFLDLKLAKKFRLVFEIYLNKCEFLSLQHIHSEKRKILFKVLQVQYTRRQFAKKKKQFFHVNQGALIESITRKYVIEREQFARKIVYEFIKLELDSSSSLKEDLSDLSIRQVIEATIRTPKHRIYGKIQKFEEYDISGSESDSSSQQKSKRYKKSLFEFHDNSILVSINPRYLEQKILHQSVKPNVQAPHQIIEKSWNYISEWSKQGYLVRKKKQLQKEKNEDHDSDFLVEETHKRNMIEEESSDWDDLKKKHRRKQRRNN